MNSKCPIFKRLKMGKYSWSNWNRTMKADKVQFQLFNTVMWNDTFDTVSLIFLWWSNFCTNAILTSLTLILVIKILIASKFVLALSHLFDWIQDNSSKTVSTFTKHSVFSIYTFNTIGGILHQFYSLHIIFIIKGF